MRSTENDNTLYPVNLNIDGRVCLVIGGGMVAARKIESLLLGGALVRVVSPEVCETIGRWIAQGCIDWVSREYEAADIDEAFLVFAATDNASVQRRIARHAVQKRVLLNSADDPDHSDFQVPAVIRRRKLLIAVSTGGGSPALAARIRHRLETEFGPEYGLLIDLMAVIRQQVLGGSKPSEENKVLFHRILDLPVLDCIRQRDSQGLERLLAAVLPPETDCAALAAEVTGV